MRELKRDLWPYKVKVYSDNLTEITPIEEWLGENFGAFKGRWNVVYYYNKTNFYFRNEEDAIIFKLTWA
jgi:hypothetical protein